MKFYQTSKMSPQNNNQNSAQANNNSNMNNNVMGSGREYNSDSNEVANDKLASGTPRKTTSFLKSIKAKNLGTVSLVIILLQVIMIALLVVLIDPKTRYEDYKQNRVISRVEKLADVNSNEEPTVAVIADIDKLRGENSIQQEVYKDAANDDYVLVYSDKIVIYRSGDDKVVYEGDSPRAILDQTQQKLVQTMVEKAKEAGVAVGVDETPQVNLVNDPAKLREKDPNFYELVEKNDLIGLFAESNTIVLYRPSEEKVLNTGSYETSITK